MLDPLRLADRLPTGSHGLIEMTEMLQAEAEMRQRGRARMLAENIGELVVLGPVHGKRALQMLTARHGISAPDQGRAVDPVAHHEQPDIVLPFRTAQEALG